MVFRFKPSFEQLEVREVPAVNWTWNPANNDINGADAANWTNDGGLVNQIPDDANDNVIFNNMKGPCNFGNAQGTLGTITVANTYTSTISIAAATTFTGSSVLGACTINLNGLACDFGNGTLGNPVTSTRVTVTGGGGIFVTNLKTTEFADVLLGSSVNVNAGGTLKMGNIAFTTGNTTSTFTVGGAAESNAAGANYFSYQLNGTSYQPINVVSGGQLNFASRSNISSYILCAGTMTVQGAAPNPNVLVSITGIPEPGLNTNLIVPGTLNLAGGSTISGSVLVTGGMNLFAPPVGGSTVCTIADGGLTIRGTEAVRARLNLNNYTLSVVGNLTLDYSDVTTHLNYDAGTLGNITVGLFAFFQHTNTLTPGASGTPRTVSLPLLTAGILAGNGDFDLYVLSPGVSPETIGNTIKLKHA